MAVDVSFCMNLTWDTPIGEDELASDIKRFHADILAAADRFGALNGTIIVRAPNVPDVRVEDEIEPAIQNICFLAIPTLLAKQHVVVRYFSHPGYFRLDPEGLKVLISGDNIPSVRVDYQEFVTALFACGERFVAFLRELVGETPEGMDRVQYLETYADAARQALLTQELLPSGS